MLLKLTFHSSIKRNLSTFGKFYFTLSKQEVLTLSYTSLFLDSSQYLRSKTVGQAVKPPEEGRKPGSSEKSMDNFHLDHIMVFADAERSRVRVV